MTSENLIDLNQPELLIPRFEGDIRPFVYKDKTIPIHKGKTLWDFEHDGQQYQIPVFSIWDYESHEEIAGLIAQGKVCAMYMWGTYGTGLLINSPEWPTPAGWGVKVLKANIKQGRPENMPFVPFMYPDDMIDFWDIDRLHKNYRHLQWAGSRHKLYESGPVHIIVPTKKRNPHIDVSLIMANDYTTSYFYMPHPAWERVVKILRKEIKHAIFAGGSLNFHGELPAFKTGQLYKEIAQKSDWLKSIGLIVVCEFSEIFDIDRGQLQIRLAQKGSDGVCEEARRGARSRYTWSQDTGYPVKDAAEGVREASSLKPYARFNDLVVDANVTDSKEAMRQYDLFAA
ncbi:hypothetical protein A3A49_02225 [Candidatus Curtissbacteria bacterium RIFCSPLOWO2_01_FULL_38_11b]|uniref:Uncharacterized protein n=1 Tax=Candidatus Curtissbacteria bacterium RIFCSPLOWO2_01_FULL_38_11b TaxID=1797725 RepID=A0A1F5GZD3_9BACT|nr:MAG: hypothetical protein A3A49_02225 [Candidatus Curtissbacteria bacterium RIFCSPLOWO2_01_FULL_38_11b]